jgi:hypothetical protein
MLRLNFLFFLKPSRSRSSQLIKSENLKLSKSEKQNELSKIEEKKEIYNPKIESVLKNLKGVFPIFKPPHYKLEWVKKEIDEGNGYISTFIFEDFLTDLK